ncbi:rod shape-determining protein MreC [Coprobacillus sp. AF34-1BH]|uniref:rod shape-determining protein MreC n=1 Tax=Faecalibacillus faecis TaxID=1982628 RepID=UPI000E4E0345|nr:rod shape-determining protein MreC [Faecalibacillus faecis]RGT62223.1 rod shape-determining protein MreC [Coprobacillus sp. AF18-40]RGT86368.1 rod shape-determining protein MreC [Coprobacillus sp. AF18-15LB]RHP27632.1 rod shape-determining protein MreC [Coprobacillus sp. AF34-1BH]
MNNRRKRRNKKIMIGVIVGVIFLSVIGFFVGRKQSHLEKTLSNSISMIEYYIVKKPLSFIGDIFNEYNDLKDVYDENKKLKTKLDSYANVEAENEILTTEIDKLKKITEIDYLPSDYQTKVATVQIRDQTNWNDEITIDLGSMNDIQEGMVVCDSKGMVGVVSKVTEISSTVSLITSENPSNQIPVMVVNGDQVVYGLLENYRVNSQKLNITLLSNIDKLEKGAKVYTSGLGGDGKSPKGIYIGKAKKLVTQTDGTTTTLMVTPAANMEDLSYVSVIKKVNNDGQ